MVPPRNMSWLRRARSSIGPTVGRLSTTAVMVPPEMVAGSIQPTVLMIGLIATRTGYLNSRARSVAPLARAVNYILLLQLVEHPAAHHPDQRRGSGQADDDHRHRQVRQQFDHPAHAPGGVDVLGREQAAHAGAEVAHHEHHQHQREQELRRRQSGQADHRQRMVADRVLVGGGEDPDRNHRPARARPTSGIGGAAAGRGRTPLLGEAVHREPRDAAEVARIPGDDRVAAGQRGCGDEQVRGRDPLSLGSQLRIDLPDHPRRGEGDGEHRNRRQQRLDEFLSSCSPRRVVGAPVAVKQLRCAHHRNPQFGVSPALHDLADELLRRVTAAFGVDARRRVDQESQTGGSATDSPARMSRRSLPNRPSSTTGERLRRYAMHSEARRGATGGGAMTHTSLPRRWTRKRPPSDSIRSRSFANERLASVADIR